MSRKSSCPRLLALPAAVALALAGSSFAYAQTSLTSPEPAAAAESTAAMQSSTRLNAQVRDEQDEPSVASAEVIEGSPETELILRGNAEIRRAGSVVKGDTLSYTQATDEVRVTGNASVARQGASFRAPNLIYRLDAKTGEMTQVEFEYAPRRLRGEAQSVEFVDGQTSEFKKASCTTCRKGDNSWRIEMSSLTLDQQDESGTGRGAVLKLGDIPVFGSPWFSFPLTDQRKSGFLTPALGMSSTRGIDIAVPYYFNIAPNYDYTLTPRLMSKRGVMLGNELRFKNSYFDAQLDADYLPDDRVTKEDRYGIHAQLDGRWRGFDFGINYNKVSDDHYTSDFANDIRGSSDEVLSQDYWLTYSHQYWNTAVRVTKNQFVNINDYSDPEHRKPYEREPQVTWNGYIADWAGFEISTALDATRFVHPTKLNGNRFVVDQKIAYPMRGAGWFLTPKAQFIGTWYDLDQDDVAAGEDAPSRTLPIFSMDAGLIFDRNLNAFSRDLTQTLEPRLFYSYIPYRDQSDLPNFDTSLADLNFAQLVNENIFSGYDRINEANHLSAMLTTRLLDAQNGTELLSASIGERYYFTDQRVTLHGTDSLEGVSNAGSSDLLASVGARLTRELQMSAFAQWSHDRSRLQRLVAGMRWHPRAMSTLGLYYRYNWTTDPNDDNFIKQVDLSAQWPIADKWYVLARQNYSLEKGKFVESLLGLEYHADCWTLRMVGQRYKTSTNKTETNYYLQLELTGLGSVGSSPLSELQRSIQGYQSHSPIPSQIGTYDYYQ